ncbi:MAG: DUF3102 domain-containing protein [Bradyrhizobium sp.]|jgi:hypothetical protein
MKKRKNTRSLDQIADALHKLDRANIIDKGDLLLEARAQCEPGQWLDWLKTEFEDYSEDSAERYMKVAKLAGRFRNLRNLRLGKTTLYALADHQCEEDLPAIIKELAKHATKKRLAPRDAKRVIQIGIGRRRFGDHPDATLVQLVKLGVHSDEPWHEKAVAALQEREPETDESASAIVDEIEQEHEEAERKAHEAALLRDLQAYRDEAKDEAENILDGAPPDLPPPTTPPEPQKLHADTAWEGRTSFASAVTALLDLRTKPAARFAGMFSPA